MPIPAFALLCAGVTPSFGQEADSILKWEFNRTGNREGWSVPEQMTGAVMGGSLWLTPTPKEKNPAVIASLNYQIYSDYNIINRIKAGEERKRDGSSNKGELSVAGPISLNIASPLELGLKVEASTGRTLVARVRVLNLSPLNNLDLKWRSKDDEPGSWHSKRTAVKPDLKQWQDITCYLDRSWSGTIDQFALGISENVMRGDIWIDAIRVEFADPEPVPARPDVVSHGIVPRISVPGLTQEQFADAFKVLDECLVVDVPAYGFSYPFIKASADKLYGDYAWPYGDTILSAAAAAWVNQSFAENVARGTAEIQSNNPDGRISGFPWEPGMGQPADNNFRADGFFYSAHDIALRTRDEQLRGVIYESMRRYLDWWLSPTKRDARTGLIMGDHEEAVGFPHLEGTTDIATQARAPVDLNSAIVVAAELTAEIAASVGKDVACARYRQVADELRQSINEWLWNENDKYYYDYDLRKDRLSTKPTAQAFFTLRRGIAPPARRDHLLARLTDPAAFNWGGMPPIVNVPKVDNKGVVLALTTNPVLSGLEDSGRFDLAAEMNWLLIQTFGRNFREVYGAPNGTGHGGTRFAFTAAAYGAR